MDPQTLAQWEGLITTAVQLGVSSWTSIRALMADAGLDDQTIADLQPRWDALRDDVARAAGHGQ